MIVKNEAHNLVRSLPPLQDLADEIIILDSGSSDNSQQIAEQYGAKWLVNTDWQGFGKQRQIAQSHATGDWILALDADEEITPSLKDSIRAAIAQTPDNTVYGFRNIDCVFGGHEIDSSLWHIKAHWRLYPQHFRFDDNLVHESVVLNGATTRVLDGYARHHTGETPLIWLQKRLAYAQAWAKDRHQCGKKNSAASLVINPVWAFVKQYLFDGRFLKGRYGLVYAMLFAQYTFNKYACLYDLSHNQADAAYARATESAAQTETIVIENKKSSLSLVMIVKNEAKHLENCLKTVHDLCDEIILLDSGSTDATREIGERYGAKWFVNADWQGFGKQRQIAQSYATSDYVLVLDADERLDTDLRHAIAQVLQQPVRTDKVFGMLRLNSFCGIEAAPFWWNTGKLARLYAREHYQYCDLKVHESLDQKGAGRIDLDGCLLHLTNDNLHHFLEKNIRYSHDWASEKHQNGKRVSLLGIIPRAFFSFVRKYVLQMAFTGGAYGYIVSCATMGYTMDKYIMLWHMKQKKAT